MQKRTAIVALTAVFTLAMCFIILGSVSVELMDSLMPGTDKDLLRPFLKVVKPRYEAIMTSTRVTGMPICLVLPTCGSSMVTIILLCCTCGSSMNSSRRLTGAQGTSDDSNSSSQ